MADVPGLDQVLSDEGWPYASAPPVEPGDPGRFHALFGRDSLITALQVLPARPDVARATLRALAARQGRREDGATQEEPGKIGHEFRDAPPEPFVRAGWPADGPFDYFASADATSWFLVVLAATGDGGLAAELEGAWRTGGDWLARALERGGGLLRSCPGTRRGGLVHQGWRDTGSGANGGGIARPDGTLASTPLADADTQAVTVAALRAMARLSGDDDWTRRAADLRARVSALFGPDVMAIEAGGQDARVAAGGGSGRIAAGGGSGGVAAGGGSGGIAAGGGSGGVAAGGRPVPGAGSQLGWLLWADALEDEAAEAVAARLSQPDVLTDYGLRTLSGDSPAFDPHAYHRGSIWPFDSWLGWGGLRAAGRAAEAERVRRGVLAALDRLGRYPELYAVTDAGELEPIAISNRVQAWTVGARWALEHEWDGRT
jgi:glycogen debranching enzyme